MLIICIIFNVYDDYAIYGAIKVCLNVIKVYLHRSMYTWEGKQKIWWNDMNGKEKF